MRVGTMEKNISYMKSLVKTMCDPVSRISNECLSVYNMQAPS